MDVKLVVRTLDLFELYAVEARPLSLTELARGLAAPLSSTLALVRTLIGKGYLYEIKKRGGYYPTKKILGTSLKIDQADPVLELIHPHLVTLRDESGETVVLGKRQDLQVIYLDTVASKQVIRYTAEPGEVRDIYSNSIGKALISALKITDRKKLAAAIQWRRHTARTLASAKALLKDAEETADRGWSANIGESVEDLAAVATAFALGGEWYGISVVGPLGRMQASWDKHVALILRATESIQQARDPVDPSSR